MKKEETFITVKELAARWRVNPLAVYRRKDKDADFPRQYKMLGKVLFKLKDIERYENKKI
jgi:hypothetical protein